MHEAALVHKKKVEEAVDYLKSRIEQPPEIILALGTGLGDIAKQIKAAVSIPYPDIPHFPGVSVPSHAGNLLVGALQGRQVAVLQGRLHYYEGLAAREVAMPVRVLSLLGAKNLIITNAAGGLEPRFQPGTLMVIRDHINFIPDNPLRGLNIDEWGPRFPDLSKAYDQQLIDTILLCAQRLGIDKIRTGIYAAIPGPSLETPAETRYFRKCGADAVGMSTVPEVIVAKHAGMRVLGLSVIANVNDPDDFKPIILEEVMAQTAAAAVQLQKLLAAFVKEI